MHTHNLHIKLMIIYIFEATLTTLKITDIPHERTLLCISEDRSQKRVLTTVNLIHTVLVRLALLNYVDDFCASNSCIDGACFDSAGVSRGL